MGLACLLLLCGCWDILFPPKSPKAPALPAAQWQSMRLHVLDPGAGSFGVRLAWTYPDSAKVSHFEIFLANRADSLGGPLPEKIAGTARSAIIPLPDSTRPFTVYLGIKAVWVEQTGQSRFSDTVPVDSLTVTPTLRIERPETNEILTGRVLNAEVHTNSDPGVLLRQFLFEKRGREWVGLLDTCLPMAGSRNPLFGRTFQFDSLIMEQTPSGDTVSLLYCVQGTESFDGRTTGLAQSLGCRRAFRAGR